MVVVVAQCHAEDLFGLVLLDDKAIQIGFDILRPILKGLQIFNTAFLAFFWGGSTRLIFSRRAKS